MRHLITLADFDKRDIERIFTISEDIKAKMQRGIREPLLPGRVMALLFEKQSLRTRVSFEAGMAHLGGSSMMLGADVGYGKRESTADFSRVLSEMVDVLVIRSKSHKMVVDIAEYATCPVINGLTDLSHPCQAMADLFTMKEHLGDLEGATLAWVGDCNNVTYSLAIACGKLGVKLRIAAPVAYHFSEKVATELRDIAPGLDMTFSEDPHETVKEANAIYTDVWASMGQEAEQEERKKHFAPYQVNKALMASAPKDAIFLHCLPARRGEEVTDEVIDSKNSVIVEQAANRMHAQKGILVDLLASQN